MLTSTDSVDLNGQPFKLYPERWTALAHFFVLQMTNSLMWVTFSPIADIAADFFGPDGFVGSLTAVNLLAVLFLILYPVGSVLASYSKSNYGLRVSLLIAAFFTVLGAFLRFIGVYVRNSVGGTSAYVMVFIGTAIVAVVQPIYINFPPTVSAIWFPVMERDIATAIGSMSNPVGNAIGTLIPVFIVYRNSSDDDNGSSIQGMSTLMLVEFLAVLVPLIVAWFSLMDSPPTPPSHSASLKITELSVHSSSALHSAAIAQTVTSMGPSPMSSSLQSHSMAFSSSTLSGGSTLPTTSPGNNVRLTDVDFEHELDEDAASFAASPNSSTGSHTRPVIDANRANPPPVRGRLSSLFDASRFSIFANADQGPKRSHKGSVLHDIHSLFQNRNFVVLVVTMSLLLGMFSAYFTVTYQLISHYDYTNRQAGVLGFVIIIAGLIGTVVVGFVMRRTRAYRSLLVGIVLSAVAFFIITLLVMVPNQFIALVFCTMLLGITMLPILPVMMENCAEIAYPISEEVATGVVFSVSNIVGLVFIFIVQALIPRSHFHRVSPFAEVKVFMGAVMIAAGVVVLFYKGEYRRLERDLSKKERSARNGLLREGAAEAENGEGARSRAGSLGERLFNKLRRTSRKQTDGSEPAENGNGALGTNLPPPTSAAEGHDETVSPMVMGHQQLV